VTFTTQLALFVVLPLTIFAGVMSVLGERARRKTNNYLRALDEVAGARVKRSR
jgi:hypothetical protein